MPLPDPIIEVLAHFRPLFTAPTWRKMMVLLTGTLLAHGRRTVTTALRHTGNEMEINFSTFHQGRELCAMVSFGGEPATALSHRHTFIPFGGTVDLVIDETLERRWGAKISKRGHYRDSALSSRKHSVSRPGLRWIVMAVVITLDSTAMGFPIFLRAHHDSRSEPAARQASQDGRHVGPSNGECGTALAS